MVGAKQFAIMRKIIEDKKENPIVKNIAMPPWMRGEQEFSKPHGNFLDKFKTKEVIIKKDTLKPKITSVTAMKTTNVDKSSIKEKVNPIVKNISSPLSVMKTSDIRKFSEGLFDRFTSLSKIIAKSQKPLTAQVIKEEEPKQEDKKEISEEVLNRITYDVFQNIKSYLEYHPINKPPVPEKEKHIKLEISL